MRALVVPGHCICAYPKNTWSMDGEVDAAGGRGTCTRPTGNPNRLEQVDISMTPSQCKPDACVHTCKLRYASTCTDSDRRWLAGRQAACSLTIPCAHLVHEMLDRPGLCCMYCSTKYMHQQPNSPKNNQSNRSCRQYLLV